MHQTMNKNGVPEDMREKWWEDEERHDAELNTKVLKVIFYTVNPKFQYLISSCCSAKGCLGHCDKCVQRKMYCITSC